MTELWRNDTGEEIPPPAGNPPLSFEVQLNPETLRVSYSTQRSGGEQPSQQTQQYVANSITRLTLELWFDVTRVDPAGDVRNLTRQVSYFLQPRQIPNGGSAPPGVAFQWGSFLLRGVVDSMDETLDLFADDGRALRASVSLSLSEQRIVRDPLASGPGSGAGPGLKPLFSASAGFSLPQMAASAGLSADWKGIASANNIENPRLLEVGARIDFSAKAG
jgi:hypothetical protein